MEGVDLRVSVHLALVQNPFEIIGRQIIPKCALVFSERHTGQQWRAIRPSKHCLEIWRVLTGQYPRQERGADVGIWPGAVRGQADFVNDVQIKPVTKELQVVARGIRPNSQRDLVSAYKRHAAAIKERALKVGVVCTEERRIPKRQLLQNVRRRQHIRNLGLCYVMHRLCFRRDRSAGIADQRTGPPYGYRNGISERNLDVGPSDFADRVLLFAARLAGGFKVYAADQHGSAPIIRFKTAMSKRGTP